MSRGRGWCGLHPSPHHLRQSGGCGGVGIWYKYRHSLPGTGHLGRGGRPEDGVNVSSLEIQLFQVLTSSLTALRSGPSSLGHQGVPRGAEPLCVPQLVTQDCFAGPHIHRLHPSPAPTCHLQKVCHLTLLLACSSPAMVWPICSGVAAVTHPACWQLGCGWGRKDALGVSSLPVVVPSQHRAACTRAPPSSIRGHRGLGPHCWVTRENRSSSCVEFWDFSEVFSSC